MSIGCSTMTDLKINDRDIAEINGFWVYHNTKNKQCTVNGKKFKVIDSYDDASTSNSIVAVGAN